MTRRLELWVQILELNDVGEFVPVEVQAAKDVHTGGIFQLKQVCVCLCLWCVSVCYLLGTLQVFY